MASAQDHANLDRIDLKILQALRQDARLSKIRMSEIVGISPSRCHERMRRLEKLGVIAGYHADVKLARMTRCSYFILQVKILNYTSQRKQQFEATLGQIEEIVNCTAVLGAFDYFITICARDIDHYQTVLERLCSLNIGEFDFVSFPVTRTLKTQHQTDLLDLVAQLTPAEKAG